MSVPGGTFLVTRTTAMSLFLLVPGKVVNQIMEYCLAWAAQGRDIVIHAVSVESNHFHIVLTDMSGQLSEFMQEFNRCSARCLLAYYRSRFPHKRLDAVWSSAQSFSATLLLTRSAILSKLVYTYTNPVKDGMVRDYRKWPGFNTRPSDWRHDVVRTAKRPAFYFKNTPPSLSFRVERPSQLDGELEQVIADVESHIRNEQRQAATNLAAQQRSFLGAKAAAKVNPFDAPSTPRPHGNLNPHLAAGSDRKALQQGTLALRMFRLAYREAWKAFRAGIETLFPGGTLLMHRRYGVPCEPLDACWCALAAP